MRKTIEATRKELIAAPLVDATVVVVVVELSVSWPTIEGVEDALGSEDGVCVSVDGTVVDVVLPDSAVSLTFARAIANLLTA